MVDRRAVANSLLFAGPEGIGKSLFAHALAKTLLGSDTHPDLHVYRPEGKIGMHSIDSMRQFSEDVYLAPFQGKWKVFIIHDAERMLTYSANALLKTFEEPAKDALIILLSSAPASLLPTILSRCRTIHFHALSTDEIAAVLQERWQVPQEEAMRLASMSQGSLGAAVRLFEQGEDQVRELLLNILNQGKFASFKELSEAAAAISSKVDAAKQQSEEAVRSTLFQASEEYLTAVQKESLQKEVDGALAVRQMAEAQALFDVIGGWYRDLQLLKVNGPQELLIHRTHANSLEQALQRGQWLELEQVQKILHDMRLALERSTSLPIVLETLFMRLNLI
jgi:DNA polymerase-3 subunit delta'